MVAGRFLAEGFGPGAVAMESSASPQKRMLRWCDFLSEGAEVGAEFVVAHDAELAVLEISAQAERESSFWL